jgi:hypothetical protein
MATLPIAAIGLGLTAASSVFAGYSSYKAGQYQSAIADMNQKIAKDNAARATHTAQVEQQDQDMVARAMLGEQTAEQGASGFTLDSGSFKGARQSARALARKDSLNIRNAGEMEKYNYLTQAANFGMQSSGSRSAGFNALLGGFLEGAGSLASGTAKITNRSRYSGYGDYA